MKKTIFTVCVDNYKPDLCQLTLPTIQKYADRIGANFELITERVYPQYPAPYEKVQAYEKGLKSDWIILIDADMIIGEDFPDVTKFVSPDSVGVHMTYRADLLFNPNEFFFRDGRRIGLASNFMAVPHCCIDVLRPLEYDVNPKEVTKREFIFDEYCFSLNLARYGLKISPVCDSKDLKKILHLNVTTGNEKNTIEKAKRWLKGEKSIWPWQASEGSL